MKKILIIILLISLSFPLFSQSFRDGEDCTLEIKNFLVDPGVSYSFDVYITRNSSTWSKLGHLVFVTEIYYSDLVFSYNSSALVNPVISNPSSIATDIVIDNSVTDMLSINLIDGGTDVPMTETLLMTISFDTVTPDATAQLSWRFGDTTIIDENSNNFCYANSSLVLLGSDNSPLPVSQGANIQGDGFLHLSPNPFGSSCSHTQLYISAPASGLLEMNVYNVRGQLVNNLYRDDVHINQDITLSWNGRDSNNHDLSTGIYLYQLLIDNKSYDIQKVVIIR